MIVGSAQTTDDYLGGSTTRISRLDTKNFNTMENDHDGLQITSFVSN